MKHLHIKWVGGVYQTGRFRVWVATPETEIRSLLIFLCFLRSVAHLFFSWLFSRRIRPPTGTRERHAAPGACEHQRLEPGHPRDALGQGVTERRKLQKLREGGAMISSFCVSIFYCQFFFLSGANRSNCCSSKPLPPDYAIQRGDVSIVELLLEQVGIQSD